LEYLRHSTPSRPNFWIRAWLRLKKDH